MVGVYTYISHSGNLLLPTIDRINRDGAACYWSEESCKLSTIKKPRFEGSKIRSEAWNEIMYGSMKIPDSFRYFSNSEMKQDSFVDLLNKWVDKKNVFNQWGLDKKGINDGFPIFIN